MFFFLSPGAVLLQSPFRLTADYRMLIAWHICILYFFPSLFLISPHFLFVFVCAVSASKNADFSDAPAGVNEACVGKQVSI